MTELIARRKQTTYEVAGAAKMCSPDTVFEAVRSGKLSGSIRAVTWDERFHDWIPGADSREVLASVRPYRYWTKSIVPCHSLALAIDMMQRRCRASQVTEAMACPAPVGAIEFMHALQDGPMDGQPASSDYHARSFVRSAEQGERFYQIRTFSDALVRGGKVTFAPLLTTPESLARVMGQAAYGRAVESGEVRVLPPYGRARLATLRNAASLALRAAQA